MYFQMPTTVYVEENCVARHGADLAKLGSHALLVTGRHSAKANGSQEDVVAVLQALEIPYTLFDGVEENPSTDTVATAAALGLEAGADFIIGIGGGSPLDAAKAIAVLMANPTEGKDFLYDAPTATALPVVAIPTTCGTGSEVTPYAVLTVHERRTKVTMTHRIFPDLALVDGKYLENTPVKILRNTAVDALSHLVESYINNNATTLSRMLVKEGLTVWSQCKPMLREGTAPTKEDCQHLMLASMLAGMAISHTGTSLPHGLSYRLTYELHHAHGKAVGRFLAGYLREADPNDRDEVLKLAGFADFIALEEFYHAVCGYEVVEVALMQQSIKDLLENPDKLKNAPFRVDVATLERIAGLADRE